MTLLFFRCSVLTRSLTRRRQDPGLDNASAIEPSGPPSAELGGVLAADNAANPTEAAAQKHWQIS